MDTILIVILVVVAGIIAAVGIGAYIWASRKKAQLDSIVVDGRKKLIRKYSENQVSKILISLDKYTNPVSLQLALDLYTHYDNPRGVSKIVNDIGIWPKTRDVWTVDNHGNRAWVEEIVQHVRTLATGIDDFGHFVVAYYTTAPRLSAKHKVRMARKYQDLDTYKKILGFKVWTGQTEDQLRDTLGEPLAVDEKVLKTKTKYIWKYDSLGRNRYGKRVTIENGVVVGFDIKGKPWESILLGRGFGADV